MRIKKKIVNYFKISNNNLNKILCIFFNNYLRNNLSILYFNIFRVKSPVKFKNHTYTMFREF